MTARMNTYNNHSKTSLQDASTLSSICLVPELINYFYFIILSRYSIWNCSEVCNSYFYVCDIKQCVNVQVFILVIWFVLVYPQSKSWKFLNVRLHKYPKSITFLIWVFNPRIFRILKSYSFYIEIITVSSVRKGLFCKFYNDYIKVSVSVEI